MATGLSLPTPFHSHAWVACAVGGLAFVLYSIGIWIIFQPMQMRGMMMDGMHMRVQTILREYLEFAISRDTHYLGYY